MKNSNKNFDKMAKRIFRFFLVLFLFNIYIISLAQDFEVAPVLLNFNAEPGQTQSIPVNIFNHSNEKTSFVLSLGDYILNKEGEKIQMPASSTEHSLVNWISINPPFLEINPNDERQVSISIQAPSGDFSTKWAYVYVKTSKEQTALLADKTLQTGVVVSGQIIIKAVQSPKTNVNYKLKIGNLSEISTNKDTLRVFTAVIDNIGDKIANCKVTLLASNLSNAQETKLDEITFESYPDAQLNIKLRMTKILPPGKYALAAILDYGSKQNLEGTQMLLEIQ